MFPRTMPVAAFSAVRAMTGCLALVALSVTALAAQPTRGPIFESPPVHPLDITPDGRLLLAVNIDEHRLSVFDLSSSAVPRLVAEIPVGLEPVTVRARTSGEAWVVNHLSDSISLVDLVRAEVVGTLNVGDEPTDVVFAGHPSRAFVCLSQEDRLRVYDAEAPGEALAVVELSGSDPRSLAVSLDGTRVHVGVLDSGNRTTVVPASGVAAGPGLPAPRPAPAAGLPVAPRVGLIVKQDLQGSWVDELERSWDDQVPYTLLDHDIITVEVATARVVGTVEGVGTAIFNLAVDPVSGEVLASNQEAFNAVRFEPNLRGRFLENRITRIDPGSGAVTIAALNPHLDRGPGDPGPIDPALSLAMPLDLLVAPEGRWVYVAAFGSARVGVLDGEGRVVDRIAVGEGPCGLAWDRERERLVVFNRLDGTLSLVDPASGETETVSLGFDSTPAELRDGRRLFYDAGNASGDGQVSCASCHLFAGLDGLAWDLGDPTGSMLRMPEFFGGGLVHPMKGPMVTQTLKGMAGDEPFHWRGDRFTLADFRGAFVSLLGRDQPLPASEFQRMETFLFAIEPPPNPFRGLDNGFPNPLAGPNPKRGRTIFLRGDPISGRACTDCHFEPSGGAALIVAGISLEQDQDMAVPPLRGVHEKTRFEAGGNPEGPRVRGFGFGHDGSFDSMQSFFDGRRFTFNSEQDRLDIEAFLFAFGNRPHAGIGAQGTLTASPDAAEAARLHGLRVAADREELGLVLRGRDRRGEPRGWIYAGGTGWDSDRAAEAGLAFDELLDRASSERPLTYTAVPREWMSRVGIDRDEDGHRDRDELDAGANPADPASFPDTTRIAGGGPALLGPVFPNPVVSGAASVSFRLDRPGPVRLTVHDVRGRLVRVLVDDRDHREGFRLVRWDRGDASGRAVGAGLYFLRLEAAGAVRSRRVALIS